MKFFNSHEVFYPWPKVLRASGFRYFFRPREVFWFKSLEKLSTKKGQKVLEVGCGRGITLDRLKKEFKLDTFGIDIAEEAIIDAKKECLFKHSLRTGSATELPFKDAFFDLVVTFDVLEHIADQKKAISEMVRVTKKGGKILIYTINKNQTGTWDWFINKLGVDVYKRSDHDPKLFPDCSWLNRELSNLGIKVTDVSYYDAFWTLAANEIITLIFMLFGRVFDWEKSAGFGKMKLYFASLFSRFISPILRIFDLPWTMFGKSNAFLLIGYKND
jgi:SAM-dependent methyltransferase